MAPMPVPARLADFVWLLFRQIAHRLKRLQAQVRLVAEWSVRCEEHFGCPQDVEWAIEHGRFRLLQSRPVTTLW